MSQADIPIERPQPKRLLSIGAGAIVVQDGTGAACAEHVRSCQRSLRATIGACQSR